MQIYNRNRVDMQIHHLSTLISLTTSKIHLSLKQTLKLLATLNKGILLVK